LIQSDSIEDVSEVLARYAPKSVLIDSNLLLLYLVGMTKPALISRCGGGRVRFEIADFRLLEKLLGTSNRLITTPHVLTEVLLQSARSLGVTAFSLTNVKWTVKTL
jgi:hypothetical protein